LAQQTPKQILQTPLVGRSRKEARGNPTLADAILDRIVHNAYRVELSGESLRKPRASA
jgi:DNA replication protein DnaC